MIQPSVASRASTTVETVGGWLGDWLQSRRRQTVTALVLYAAVAVAYFGVPLIAHFGRTCLCGSLDGADPSLTMWSLAWWPHALLHGQNPFVTHAVFVPDRINIGGAATAPGAALALTPVTLLFGPFVSYNVLMLASLVLAGWFAFLLCRYITNNFTASLIGGYLFGFSAYMIGQILEHAYLVLVFPVPAAVHLTLRLIDDRISTRRYIVLAGITMAALISFSTETTLTFVLLGAITVVVALILAPAARRRMIAAIPPMIFAGLLGALISSPIIFYGLKNNVAINKVGLGEYLGGDALGFFVPSVLFRLGRNYFAAVSSRFSIGYYTNGVYLGLPLVLILARYMITRWRRASTWILAVMLAIVVVAVLGSQLHIAGYATVPLPWKVIDGTLLGEATPARLALYMFLIVAVTAAMWLAQPRTWEWAAAKWAAMAVSIVFLLPNLGSGLWHNSPSNPKFFASHAYRNLLRRDETVLVVPYGYYGFSMLWQAETDFRFRMTGGWLVPAPPPDYLTDPLLPALQGVAKPDPKLVRRFLTRRHVGAVVVDPTSAPTSAPQWSHALSALGLKPRSIGGVLFYRV